ncbi:hypothetical protein [Laspinema olomoucense]|nr:hypothetical protein [Laspinema sp. D3c]MCT7992447.1 hypothetical protein [Laspinema sp. D3c]
MAILRRWLAIASRSGIFQTVGGDSLAVAICFVPTRWVVKVLGLDGG